MTKKPIEQIHNLIVLVIVINCSSNPYLEEEYVRFRSTENTLASLIFAENYTTVLSKTEFFTRCNLICVCQFRYQTNPTILWVAVLWLNQYTCTLTIKTLITYLYVQLSHAIFTGSVHGNRSLHAMYFIQSDAWNVKNMQSNNHQFDESYI